MARRRRTLQRASEVRSLDPLRDFEGGPVQLLIARIFYFFRINMRALVLAAIAVALLLAIGIAYLVWKELQEQESLIAFEELMEEPVMQPDSGAEEVALEKLGEYRKNFTDRGARLRADLHILDYLEELGRYEEAFPLALSLAKAMDTPELRYYYYLKTGFLAESLKKYQEASEAYQQAVLAMRSENYFKAMALLGQARMLIRLGMKEEARRELGKALAIKENDADRLYPHIAAYLLQLDEQSK